MLRLLSAVLMFVGLIFSPWVVAQSVTINFDVFGLNENQFLADQTLENACSAIGQIGTSSAAATDLLNTCSILNPLDEESAALATALDRLIPEEAFAISDQLTDNSDLQITNVSARINALREQQTGGGLNLIGSTVINSGGGAAAGRLQKLELFFNGQLSTGEVDGRQLQQNADVSASQFTVGADYRLSDNLILGVGFGVFQHETNFTNTAGDSQVDGANLTLFGMYVFNNQSYLDVVLDAGSNSYDFSRQVNLEGSSRVFANASTDSSSTSLSLGIGRSFNVSGWELGPYLRASITSASVDGYSERADSSLQGFGSILRVDSQSINSTTLSIGGNVARVISTGRAVIVPQLSLEVEIEADDEKDPLSASFLADPDQQTFKVDGEKRDTGYINLGVGSTAAFQAGRSAYAYYETRLAHDLITQHWFKVGARIEF